MKRLSRLQSNVVRQSGFTFAELLVGMMLFSVVGLSLVAFSTSVLRDVGLQSRATVDSLELGRALSLLSNELRMSSSMSPYLPGSAPSTYSCTAAVQVTPTTIKFLVVEDDASATTTSGLKPYYVGYKYDAATRQLLRGEVAMSSIFTCSTPGSDPTSSSFARLLSENVEQIDTDGNGTVEAAFVFSNSTLTINLGSRALGGGNQSILQKLPTRVFQRVS